LVREAGELPPSFNVFGRSAPSLDWRARDLVRLLGLAVARVVQAAPRLPARSPFLYLNAAVFANAVSLTLGGISNERSADPRPGSSLHYGASRRSDARARRKVGRVVRRRATPYRVGAPGPRINRRIADASRLFHAVLLLAALVLALISTDGRAQGRLVGPDIASGLSVQFTDNFLKQEGWQGRLDLISALGATVVRIDLNWPWVEAEAGSYDWSLYDQYAAELSKRRLRPLFILNRPNSPYGKPYEAAVDGKRERGTARPARRRRSRPSPASPQRQPSGTAPRSDLGDMERAGPRRLLAAKAEPDKLCDARARNVPCREAARAERRRCRARSGANADGLAAEEAIVRRAARRHQAADLS